jgi:hypothetical protein
VSVGLLILFLRLISPGMLEAHEATKSA